MKAVIWISLISVLAAEAFGQRGAGFGVGQHPTNSGIPPVHPIPTVRPIPPLGRAFPGRHFVPQFGFGPQAFPAAFPFYFGDYDYTNPYEYQPAPNVVIVQQPPAYPLVPETPLPAVQSEIREYKQPASAGPEASGKEEQPAFAIALKDGSVRSAVAVSVQDDIVNYVDPDGRHEQFPLGTVDRETTRRLNRERNLQLQLPLAATK
jgi:hypothetical protein